MRERSPTINIFVGAKHSGSKYRVTTNNLYTVMLHPDWASRVVSQQETGFLCRGECENAPTWLGDKDGLKKPGFWGFTNQLDDLWVKYIPPQKPLTKKVRLIDIFYPFHPPHLSPHSQNIYPR